MSYPVQAYSPVALRPVAAILKRAHRSGYWSVWAVHRDDARQRPSRDWRGRVVQTTEALETNLTSAQAARRFPAHAAAILGRPDSTD